MYISMLFVFLWWIPLYIENIQYVIDKYYHSCLISKVFNMVFAGDVYTIIFYTI